MKRDPIVLLQPPGACRAFTRSASIYPPLGLCCLAATVPADSAIVVDADGLNYSQTETLMRICAIHPVAVAMTVTSFTLDQVEQLAAIFLEANIPTIVGGPHASLAPEDTLKRCPSVQWAIRGEGELVFPEIVERLQKNTSLMDIPGVCGRNGSELSIHSQILKVEDLGSLQSPRYDGLPIQSYWCPDAVYRPMVTMITSRGCPHRCAFCSSPELLGRKVRFRPIHQIINDIENLIVQHGVKEISFVDDVFTIKKTRLLDFCNNLIQREFKISWFCNARADQITDELASAMKAAGCHQVYLGFESGDQSILDRIQKGTTIQHLERGAEILRKHGIHRSVGFVIGLPGENDASVEASIMMACRVRPERLQFTRFTPLVGSPLASFASSSYGFHNLANDKVSEWIAQCYQRTGGKDWGRESW